MNLTCALSLRLRVHLEQGEAGQAATVLERLQQLALAHSGAPRGTRAEIDRLARYARAQASLHWRDFPGAVAILRQLLEECRTAGRWAVVASVHAALAVALAQQEWRASRESMTEALRLGHRLGLTRSLLDASPQVPSLVERLLQEQALDSVLAFYARRLLSAAASRQVVPVEAAPTRAALAELLNEREREVLTHGRANDIVNNPEVRRLYLGDNFSL